MNQFAENAVKSTRDYLVHLLLENKWCTARAVGRSLEQLVDAAKDDDHMMLKATVEQTQTAVQAFDSCAKAEIRPEVKRNRI